jgi:hypothetical protein
MVATKVKLIPLDLERCQAEVTIYHPFLMGGSVRQTKRCEKKPTWLAKEAKAGKDGRRGSMTLCDECKAECEEQMRGRVQFSSLKTRSKQDIRV